MSKTCNLETTPEHEVPFLRTKSATTGIVYVRNAAENQILLVKVDFSQSEAYRVSHSYFILPPKQSLRVKVQVEEAKLDAAKSNLMRVLANEIKSMSLYKSTSYLELREEWRRHRSHYENEKACRTMLRCLPATFAQDPISFPQFYSMNSARSGLEEPTDLSLYPMVDEKVFRSRNGRSPGHSLLTNKFHTWYNEEKEGLSESLDRKKAPFAETSEPRYTAETLGREQQSPFMLRETSSSKSRLERDRASGELQTRKAKGLSAYSTSKEISQSGSLTTHSKNLSRNPIDEAIYTGINDEFINLENNFLDGRSSLKAREDYHSLVIRARKTNDLASHVFQQPPAGSSFQPDALRRLSSYSRASYSPTDGSKNCDPRIYKADVETRLRNKEGQIKDLAYDCDDLRREVQKLKFVGLNNGPATHPRPEAKKADRLSLALLLACCFLAFLVGKNLL